MPLFVPQPLIQTAFTELTVDTTTTSVTFVDLMSLTMNVGSNKISVHFTVGGSNNQGFGGNLFFRLVVDGVTIRGTAVRSTAANVSETGALVWRGAVVAGSRIVKIQWMTDVGTARIAPVTVPNGEHASLYVQEITV